MEQKDDPLHKATQNRKVIVFNGPPCCGKDTAAAYALSYIRQHAMYLTPMHMKFAEPLKKAAHDLYAVFHNWDYYDSKDGAPVKNMASGDFLGLSPRDAYIEMSNKLKELHGPSALGYIMRKRMVRHNSVGCFITSDGGFVDELEPLVSLLGQRNVLVVEIHAVDKTFVGDSRGYVGNDVQMRWPKVTVKKLPNTIGTLEDKEFFKMLVEGTVKGWLGIEEKDG